MQLIKNYDEIIDAFIRPNRQQYSNNDLGVTFFIHLIFFKNVIFNINNIVVKRIDFELEN